MKLLITLAFLLLSTLAPGASFAASPLILNDAPAYPLAGHLEQLVDPGGRLTLADVLAPATAARFAAIPGNMNRGYTRDAVWLRFRVVRSAPFPEGAYLSLAPPYLDTVAVYLPTGGNPADPAGYRLKMMGDHVPVGAGTMRTVDFVAPLALPQGAPTSVYLRVNSTSTVTLSGAILSPEALVTGNNLGLLLNGGYLAVALVIVLINLLFYLRLRDRLYLYFSGYIFFNFLSQLSIVGLLPLILPAWAHLLADYFTGCGIGLLICFFALFVIRLFDLSPGSPSRRFFTGICLLGGVTVLSVPLGFYGQIMTVLLVFLFVTVILLTVHSVRAVRRREPGGLLYLAAFGVGNLGFIVLFLRLLGLIPTQWWNLHVYKISTLCNMIFMTMAVTERLHAAEEKALRAARESEHKAVELAEEMTHELRDKQGELEQSLANERQALREKSRFLAMLSHEYRTPLAIIQANLNLLELQETEGGEGTEQHVATMKHAVRRLVEVMEVSLNQERLGPGVRQKPARIELVPFLDEIIDEAERFWPERFFVFQATTTPVVITGDAGQLKSALLNLLDNACKYSPPPAPITVDCWIDAEVVSISVHDRGPGISHGESDAVFEKFRRGSSSHGTSGAGLGLWLVRQIVQQHGGSITLTPDETEGTRATVRLPLAG